jgi:hypothetical protein
MLSSTLNSSSYNLTLVDLNGTLAANDFVELGAIHAEIAARALDFV